MKVVKLKRKVKRVNFLLNTEERCIILVLMIIVKSSPIINRGVRLKLNLRIRLRLAKYRVGMFAKILAQLIFPKVRIINSTLNDMGSEINSYCKNINQIN